MFLTSLSSYRLRGATNEKVTYQGSLGKIGIQEGMEMYECDICKKVKPADQGTIVMPLVGMIANPMWICKGCKR